MDNSKEIFCRLCLNNITDKNFDEMTEVTRVVLDSFSLKLNLNKIDQQHVICSDCSAKLTGAFDFKMMCLDTEDSVLSYLNSESVSNVDIKDIYLKEKGGLKLTDVSDHKVCRLCMELVYDEIAPLKVCALNILHEYIPEMTIDVTEDPVMCKKCCDSLNAYNAFLNNIKRKIKNICSETKLNFNIRSEIKSEEIDLKLESDQDSAIPFYNKNWEEEVDKNQIKYEHCVIKNEIEWQEPDSPDLNKYSCVEGDGSTECVNNFQSPDLNVSESNWCEYNVKVKNENKESAVAQKLIYKCNECNFECRWKSRLAYHQVKHKDPSEVQMYKCGECDYQTKQKSCLKSHELKHKTFEEKQIYHCNECRYETHRKQHLKSHLITHQNPAITQMYKCTECDFQAKRKSGIRQHRIIHKAPNEIQMYQCNTCDFQTKRKHNLTQHEIKHKVPSEMQLYRCPECLYGTYRKDQLRYHLLVHKDPSEVRMYKCDQCDYQTKRKRYLKDHEIKHKTPTEKQKYECHESLPKTHSEEDSKFHLTRHQSASKAQMYKCTECDFQTKRKSGIRQHSIIHKDPTQMQIYKCPDCNYGTYRKNSLRCHLLVHKDPSELRMYKCDKCDFQTKRKGTLKLHETRQNACRRTTVQMQ